MGDPFWHSQSENLAASRSERPASPARAVVLACCFILTCSGCLSDPAASSLPSTESALPPTASSASTGTPIDMPTPTATPAPHGKFTSVGSLAYQDGAWGGAFLLADGRVLVVAPEFADAQTYDPTTGKFSPYQLPAIANADTAMPLPDGRWLVFGIDNHLSILDLENHRVTPAGAMEPDRQGDFVTVQLTDGRILIAGGTDKSGQHYLTSAEIYDPATFKFAPTGSMLEGRESQTAILLPDGKVLIAGGDRGTGAAEDILSTAELYDPATGKFTATGRLTMPRTSFDDILLPDGRVLLIGGFGRGTVALAGADIYDPATSKFTATGSMANARVNFTATLLKDGRVLVTGGDQMNETALATAEIYDPATGTFSPTGAMLTARTDHDAILLRDGSVLVYGGQNESGGQPTAELYWP